MTDSPLRKTSRPARSPGQRRYESSNPWSRNAQYKGRFFWENQTAAVQKTWEDAAAQDAKERRSRKPVHFATPQPVNNHPARLTPGQRAEVERILRSGPC